jgi:hypothetical protein
MNMQLKMKASDVKQVLFVVGILGVGRGGQKGEGE